MGTDEEPEKSMVQAVSVVSQKSAGVFVSLTRSSRKIMEDMANAITAHKHDCANM
jgi:hypothetical protein